METTAHVAVFDCLIIIDLCNTSFLMSTNLPLNGNGIGSAIFAGLTLVISTQTTLQTSVATARIYAHNAYSVG